jgi:hypothetical protein
MNFVDYFSVVDFMKGGISFILFVFANAMVLWFNFIDCGDLKCEVFIEIIVYFA